MGFLDFALAILVGVANASARQNVNTYQNATPIQRRVYELNKMGIMLGNNHRYEEALEYFLEADRLMPNERIIQNNIKLCRRELYKDLFRYDTRDYADTNNVKFVRNKKPAVNYSQNYANNASSLENNCSNNEYNTSSDINYYVRYCDICNRKTKFVGSSSDDKYMYCSVCYNIIGTKNEKDSNSTSNIESNAHELHLKKIDEENKIKKELLSNISFDELYDEFIYQIELFGDDSSINKSKKDDLIRYFLENYTLSEIKEMF